MDGQVYKAVRKFKPLILTLIARFHLYHPFKFVLKYMERYEQKQVDNKQQQKRRTAALKDLEKTRAEAVSKRAESAENAS